MPRSRNGRKNLGTGNGFAVTTIDGYLLRRFWHVFGIGFFAAVGLFVVFDGFTNVDVFQEQAKDGGPLEMLRQMARHYGCQTLLLLDMIGPILNVIATMVVFALLQKNREIHPILSAGVPTFRLVVPMLVGSLMVHGLLMLNQEVVLPALSSELLKPMGANSVEGHVVQTRRDLATHIEVSGHRLKLAERTLSQAEFLLPAPELVSEITTLKAEHAVFLRKSAGRPAGWVLKHPNFRPEDLRLTAAGEKIVQPMGATDIFVATDIGCEQLLGVASAFRYLSTRDLVEQLRTPSLSVMTTRSQQLHLHERMTRPIVNLLAVCLTVPFVLRRESFSLILNMAVCAGVMVLLLGFAQAALYLGRINWMPQDFAVWLPIIVTGGLLAWTADRVQT